jgi:hypothetical protein
MHVGRDGLALHGVARDLVTGETTATVTDAASVSAWVDPQGVLTELTVDPDDGDRSRLVGVPVGAGFRKAVHSAYPVDVADSNAVALLLDDLPVAALISGYARLYSGEIPADATRDGMKADICSGWRSDGTMMTSVGAGHGVPVTIGPSAPPLDADVELDPLGWHRIDRLPEGAMRRRRLVDVHVEGETWIVNAMFRDTHAQVDGDETVLHEYSLTGAVDGATGSFVRCSAVPRVLPWVECPVAAASADRLVGQQLETTRAFVGRELRGVSTCTHLNDLLRSLGDVGSLVSRLAVATNAEEIERS